MSSCRINSNHFQKQIKMSKAQKQQEPIKQAVTYTGLLATVGSRYIIDKEFRNGGEIELVTIYGKHFCRVKDPDTGAEWDTMLNRLSNCG